MAGVHGYRDLSPSLACAQFRLCRELADKHYTGVMLPNPFGRTARSLSALDLARHVSTPAGLDWLLNSLGRYVAECDVVLLPPVCGLQPDGSTLAVLCRELGRPVRELLTIPPAVGGLRMRNALLQALHKAGVKLFENAVCSSAEVCGRRCLSIETTCCGRQLRHEAKAFVVATGGILGQGISLGPGWAKESVFGLPVSVPANVEDLSGADIFEEHLFSRLGVLVDAGMRPLAADGSVALENVFFVGRTLGGYDYAAEKSGHGVAVASGWQAGRMAAAICGQGE